MTLIKPESKKTLPPLKAQFSENVEFLIVTLVPLIQIENNEKKWNQHSKKYSKIYNLYKKKTIISKLNL